ncbi:hypothetical protein, partial [Aquabacterium sp.]|uniref:hypothetical protein n=1 Tax=Aquabacterium sp. TaxID=1872578 RepID=UPI0035C69A28
LRLFVAHLQAVVLAWLGWGARPVNTAVRLRRLPREAIVQGGLCTQYRYINSTCAKLTKPSTVNNNLVEIYEVNKNGAAKNFTLF